MKQKVSLVVLVAFTYTLLLQGVLPAASATKRKQRYSLAVLDLEVSGAVSASDAMRLSRKLRDELRGLGIFEVIDRLSMMGKLQEAGSTQQSCATMPCAISAGATLGVQLVVAGSVRHVGQTFYIDAFMVHVASGEEVETVSDQMTGTIDDAVQYMAVIAKKLVGVPVETTSPAGQPIETRKRGASKWLRYAALGALGAGGVVAVILATGSSGGKSPGKLPGPPAFPGTP